MNEQQATPSLDELTAKGGRILINRGECDIQAFAYADAGCEEPIVFGAGRTVAEALAALEYWLTDITPADPDDPAGSWHPA